MSYKRALVISWIVSKQDHDTVSGLQIVRRVVNRAGLRTFAKCSQNCIIYNSVYFYQMFAELYNLQFCVLLPIVRRVVNYTILCTTTT